MRALGFAVARCRARWSAALVPTDRELADRAASAYAAGARKHPGLSHRGAVDDSGGLMRRATGSPLPFFSWLYVTSDDVDEDALADAVAWFDARDQPFSVRLREHQTTRYDATLRSLGFGPELEMPGMVATPIPSVTGTPDGLTVERVADLPSYDEFTARVAPGAPGDWLTTDAYRSFMTPHALADPDLAMFVGRVDGRPLANAAARVDDGVVVVFAVGTEPAYRRRGIGAAMTAAALEWGREQGADLAFLTSSEMAKRMYGSMGFRTVDTWHFYLRPRADS